MSFEDINKLCNEATPGPWYFDSKGSDEGEKGPHGVVWFDAGQGRTAVFERAFWNLGDAKFVAAARTEVPALIERIKELEVERAKLLCIAEMAKLIAFPRGFRNGNVPDDLHRALTALEAL